MMRMSNNFNVKVKGDFGLFVLEGLELSNSQIEPIDDWQAYIEVIIKQSL